MNMSELRFPEFEGEWEEKRVSETAETIDGDRSHRYPNEKDLVNEGIIFLSTFNMEENKLNFKEKRFITENKFNELKRGHLKQNDLIVNLRGSGIGKIILFKTDLYLTGFINAQMMIIRLSNEINDDFFYNWYISPITQKNLIKISSGSAQPQLTRSDINNLKIQIPSLPEQEKIASFLSKVDEKIEKLEKKEELWQFYKKGMMQQIFSQKLRFKDENGNDYLDWEEKKLRDIFRERSEKGFEDLQLLSVTLKKGVIKRDEIEGKDNSSENKSNYKRVLPNDIPYNSMRMWQGASGVSQYEGIVSPAYTVLIPTERTYSEFFGYYFKTHEAIYQFKKYSQGLTSDTWNLKYPLLSEIKVEVPTLSEQTKIGAFLSTIDKKIENIQKELEINKQFKKGLLQQMFPSDKKSEDIKAKDLSKLHDKQCGQTALL